MGTNGVLESQSFMITHCLEKAQIDNVDWMCIYDFDEFIEISERYGNLHYLFEKLTNLKDQITIGRMTFMTDVCTSNDTFPRLEYMPYRLMDIGNEIGAPKSCHNVKRYTGKIHPKNLCCVHRVKVAGETLKLKADNEFMTMKHYREITATNSCRMLTNETRFLYKRRYFDPCHKMKFERNHYIKKMF